jgi:hypothetical protein
MWSHLFSGVISDEVVELLVVYAFEISAPNGPPSSSSDWLPKVKYGKVCTLWYDAAGSSGIMGLTFWSSAHVTKVNGRNMGLLFKLAKERLTKAQFELKHTLTLAVVKELLT